jgi:drug/metabolite transporter (DMT)-like permease
MSARSRALVMATLGTTAWSTTPLFYEFLLKRYDALQPSTLVFWRNLMVGVVLTLLLALFRPQALRIGRRDLPFFAAYGFVGLALVNALWTYNVKYNGAAVANVLAYCSTAFTVVLAWLILKERLTARRVAAVLLSLAGSALVAEAYRPDAWRINLIGLLVGLATGLAFAAFNLMARWSSNRFASVWTLVAYGFLFSSVGLALTQTPAAAFSLGAAWDGWALIAFIALVPTLIGFGL